MGGAKRRLARRRRADVVCVCFLLSSMRFPCDFDIIIIIVIIIAIIIIYINTKTCLNWPQTDERRKQGFQKQEDFDG